MLFFLQRIKLRLDDDEIILIEKIIGTSYNDKKLDYSKIITIRLPALAYKLKIHNFSLPYGIIGIPENPLSSDYSKSILVHEIFHQMQYIKSMKSFLKLVIEQIKYRIKKIDVYDYGTAAFADGTKKIETLDDIRHLEAQAKFVQDFALTFLSLKKSFEKYKEVLSRSGFDFIS